MPQMDFSAPRLFVEAALAAGETVALERNQSNYLGNVLRLTRRDRYVMDHPNALRYGSWRRRTLVGGAYCEHHTPHRRG